MTRITSAFFAATLALATGARAAVYTVTSNADDGSPGTLRGAIQAAMFSSSTRDTIVFKLKRPVIRLTQGSIFVSSSNPNKKIVINGFSQQKGRTPPVTINARGFSAPFLFKRGNHVLRGFQIFNFSGAAVFIDGGGNGDGGNARVRVEKNWIGFSKNKAGKITTNNSIRAHGYGVIIYGSGNTIAKNVISGVHNGINIGYNPDSSDTGIVQQSNVISGNFIGTDPAGGARLGNTSDGIFMGRLAQNNVILQNTIAGNDSAGVEMLDPTTTGNRVIGNFIGTDKTGSRVIGNGDNGVHIANYATGNTVGGSSAAERNVISGNKLIGVLLSATPDQPGRSMTNKVLGNYIGCDAAGGKALGSQDVGIMGESGGSANNELSGNVVGGNAHWGIYLVNCYANKVLDNRVGIGPASQAIGNGRIGIVADGGGNHSLSGNNVQFNGFGPDGASYSPCGVRFFNSPGSTETNDTVANNR